MPVPQVYESPFARWFLVALLVVALFFQFGILLSARSASRPRRSRLFLSAVGTSVLALFTLLLVHGDLWTGGGPFFLALGGSPAAERLARNLALWTPALLLATSTGLAGASGQRRLGLLLWFFITVPASVIALYAVAVMGLSINPL